MPKATYFPPTVERRGHDYYTRRYMRSGRAALKQLILHSLADGPNTRRELIDLGKDHEFTPADVRDCIERLCFSGEITHHTEGTKVTVELVKEGK